MEYEISMPGSLAGGPEDKDVVVAFRGADQDFLLERNAELTIGARTCGTSLAAAGSSAARPRSIRLRRLSGCTVGRIETFGARGRATRARNGPAFSFQSDVSARTAADTFGTEWRARRAYGKRRSWRPPAARYLSCQQEITRNARQARSNLKQCSPLSLR